MTDSQDLLAEYGKTGSETVFRELVTRYIDLVYSTAFRLVDGDAHRAEDVAQTVFLDLSRAAGKMSSAIALGGWLHRHTCFVAAKVMRGERRRQIRERQAAEMNAMSDSDAGLKQLAPILDEAINELGEQDRRAILLRFYERRDMRSVGEALGSSENAAQKRVARALEQLHLMLTRRGIVFPAGVLGTVLAAEAVTAAPVGLAASIAGAAVTGVPAVLGVVTMTKAKLSIVAAIALAGIITPLAIQHQARLRLLEEHQALRRQASQIDQFRSQIGQLSNELAQSRTSPAVPDRKVAELLRLRGEVGRLRDEKMKLEERLDRAAAQPDPQPALPEGWRPRVTITNRVSIIPKAQWAFAGNSTPETVLQSALCALREADWKTFLGCLTPEAQKRMEERRSDKPDCQVLSDLSEIDSYFLAVQEIFSDEEVVLTVGLQSLERETGPDGERKRAPCRTAGATAKKLDNEWKLDLDWDW